MTFSLACAYVWFRFVCVFVLIFLAVFYGWRLNGCFGFFMLLCCGLAFFLLFVVRAAL